MLNMTKGMFKVTFMTVLRWVLEAMKLYLQMLGKETLSLENHSPYQVRQLLHKVLSVKDWASNEK